MKIVMFYHSLVSDWNHGNAHFLRGIATELIKRGHDSGYLRAGEGWSSANLIAKHGSGRCVNFARFSASDRTRTTIGTLDLDRASTARISCWFMNGTTTSWYRRIGEHRSKTGGDITFFFMTLIIALSPRRSKCGSVRSVALRRRSRLRRFVAATLRETPLGLARVDVARSGGHECVLHVAQLSFRGRSRLDRQLGR